jgi:hypothetical protein
MRMIEEGSASWSGVEKRSRSPATPSHDFYANLRFPTISHPQWRRTPSFVGALLHTAVGLRPADFANLTAGPNPAPQPTQHQRPSNLNCWVSVLTQKCNRAKSVAWLRMSKSPATNLLSSHVGEVTTKTAHLFGNVAGCLSSRCRFFVRRQALCGPYVSEGSNVTKDARPSPRRERPFLLSR